MLRDASTSFHTLGRPEAANACADQAQRIALLAWDDTQATAEGWGLFNDPPEVQRLDDAGMFASDDDALVFIAQRAAEGSAYHIQTLALITR